MIFGTRNPYFNWQKSTNEFRLYENMSNEVARIYGVQCYYIAQNFQSYNKLYGETESESYTYAWPISIIQKNVLGFEGDRDFISKIASLEIRDQIKMSIPRKTFEEVIGHDRNFPPLPPTMPGPAIRPREGDLIWYPFNKKCFKIMFVNLTDMFWQLGKLYSWEVTCELYEYSGETFNTGIPDIDRIQTEGSLNIYDWALRDTDGTILAFDPWQDIWVQDQYTKIFPIQDNTLIDSEANTYIDWQSDNIDPFADANNQGGTI